MRLNTAQGKPIFVFANKKHMIKSLEEIREYGRKWAELPTKVIRTIPAEDILHLYMAANKFVPELLQHYARLYDFPDYQKGTVRFLRGCGGLCSQDNHIKIGFLEVLFADDTRFRTILLHELCHTRHHNHKIPFWESLDTKLKETSIINKDDDSRKKWLKYPGFKDLDAYYLYDTPGGIYENVSAYKLNIIRKKICKDYSKNKIWNMRTEEGILKFAEIYRLIYNVGEDIYADNYYKINFRLRVPQDVLNILINICTNNQLTKFDDTDMEYFFTCGRVFEIYTEHTDKKVQTSDAINKVMEKSKQTEIRHVTMVLFVFSAKTSSSIPLNNIAIPHGLFSTNTQIRCIFMEESGLTDDIFCIHLLLAGD